MSSLTPKKVSRRGRWQLFSSDGTAGIGSVFSRGVEADATHRILHVKVSLKLEGDLVGITDDEQIVRHTVGGLPARPGALTLEELVLVVVLADLVAVCLLVDVEELVAGLLVTQIQQRS